MCPVVFLAYALAWELLPLMGDLNRNGLVADADLSLLLGNWGEGTAPLSGPPVPVPEPSTLLLLLAAKLCLLRRKSRPGKRF